jgi:hypothetical protein
MKALELITVSGNSQRVSITAKGHGLQKTVDQGNANG